MLTLLRPDAPLELPLRFPIRRYRRKRFGRREPPLRIAFFELATAAHEVAHNRGGGGGGGGGDGGGGGSGIDDFLHLDLNTRSWPRTEGGVSGLITKALGILRLENRHAAGEQPVVGVERLHPLPLPFPALQDALVNCLAKRVFEEHDSPLRTESCLIVKPLVTVA